MSIQETGQAHHHRSSLKQRNKPFKGGSGRSQSKGRTEGRSQPAVPNKTVAGLNRHDRRLRAHLIQQSKRAVLTNQKRIYNGKEGMSKIIAVIPVSSGADQADRLPLPVDPATGRFYSERCKQNLQFLPCPRSGKTQATWLLLVLEAIQVADCVLITADGRDGDLDEAGREALAVIRAIGASSYAAFVSHMSGQKHSQQVRSRWLSILQAGLSSVTKVFCADSMLRGVEERETVEFERLLSQQALHGISWRDPRPYLLAEKVETDLEESTGQTVLRITGHVRGGRPFSANRLVHIPLLGQTFSLSKVTASPSSIATKRDKATMETDSAQPIVQLREEDKAEPLESETAGDMFAAEAMMDAAEAMGYSMDEEDDDDQSMNGGANPVARVPKGTSLYQAAWLDPSADLEEDDSVPLDKLKEEEEQREKEHEGEDERLDDDSPTGMMDVEEHAAQLAEHKKLQYSQHHFPDEIDLDPHTSARTRLQKYRGVASLRTSTWDENEGLPTEYGRIFRFANFRKSRKAALGEPHDGPFQVGQKVALVLHEPILTPEQIQALRAAIEAQRPLIVFGLLRHEQRQSVLHFTFTRAKSFTGSLCNKERLLSVVGFRSMLINPIFSEHTTHNLHKMLRSVGPEATGPVVGTIYAPIAFNPAPVLLFRPKQEHDREGDKFDPSQELELVGCGSVLEVDPSRIILKRVTLTGAPFKVHKRSVVVRFMFSNPQDIVWFRPVELCTRLGGRGHIRESLGTHGYMKCHFDRVVFHHDTVAMHLYKRAFPKWTTKYFSA